MLGSAICVCGAWLLKDVAEFLDPGGVRRRFGEIPPFLAGFPNGIKNPLHPFFAERSVHTRLGLPLRL